MVKQYKVKIKFRGGRKAWICRNAQGELVVGTIYRQEASHGATCTEEELRYLRTVAAFTVDEVHEVAEVCYG